jgi:hypothetical protein
VLAEERLEANGKISRRGRCLVRRMRELSFRGVLMLRFRGGLPHN